MSNTDYLSKTASTANKVYQSAIDLQCQHINDVYCYEDIVTKKHINCAAAMSIALQLSGCLGESQIVSHTIRCGLNGAKLKAKKATIDACMTGYENLKHCSIIRVDSLYKDLPSQYQRAGVCYIYDSNCAISAGNGVIYSCNNGLFQLNLKKKYIKNKMSRGYCFHHHILYCIIPQS